MVEFNSTTSFKEQLQIISETGVFISVHTSNLANAQFLPPGAAVIELIQRNWIWHNLDKSFQVGGASVCAGGGCSVFRQGAWRQGCLPQLLHGAGTGGDCCRCGNSCDWVWHTHGGLVQVGGSRSACTNCCRMQTELKCNFCRFLCDQLQSVEGLCGARLIHSFEID